MRRVSINYSARNKETYIIVCKNQLPFDLLETTKMIKQPKSIILHSFSKRRPRHTTYQTAFAPWFRSTRTGQQNFIVKPRDHLLAAVDPFIPITEHCWPTKTFILQQFNTIMKFPHTFRDLPGSLGIAQFLRGQWMSVEVFLETAILECAQHSWSDIFSAQSAKYLKFPISINQMLNLRTINTKKQFPKEKTISHR